MPVIIKYKEFGILPIRVIWFNDNPDYSPSRQEPIQILRQSVALTKTKEADCFEEVLFDTAFIDLSQPAEELYKDMEPKSCRYEIRKVQKLVDAGEDIQIKKNFDWDNFLQVANDYIKIKKYSRPLKISKLTRFTDINSGDLFSIYYKGKLVGGNFYIRNYPERVRLLYSFNGRFQDNTLRKLSGPFMRYLHWIVMSEYYKKEGFQWYDMGGIKLDANSLVYGITQFKLSFGGSVRQEHNYVFVSNALIGRLLAIYKKISTYGLRKY